MKINLEWQTAGQWLLGGGGQGGVGVRKFGGVMDRLIILIAVIVSWVYMYVKIIKLYP